MFNNYMKVVIRYLLRHKGYLVTNVFGLAIGLASCVLIVLYIQDELSFDQYHENKDRIYRLAISETAGDKVDEWAMSPAPWAPVLVQDYPEIENVTRVRPPGSRWLIRHEERRFYEADFVFVDSTFFDLFSVHLIRGDAKSALDEPHAVVLSASVAKKYFGDGNPIGEVITGDNKYEFTVTGVMQDLPDNSHFHFDFLASFTSLAANGLYGEPSTMQNHNHSLYTYLMLREGAVPEDLEMKLSGFPNKYLGERLETLGIELRPFLQPLTEIHLNSNLKGELEANSDILYVYIFSTLAAFVLLVACINYMNLSTARSARRAHEVGIRKVLGSHQVQLINQFMSESILFSSIALVVAIGLVHLLLPQFNLLSGKSLEMDYGSSWLVPTLVAIAILTGVSAGGYPAFVLSSFRPIAVLTGSLKAGTSHSLLRKTLITFQFAVSIVMIIGTVVVLYQLEYMQNKKLGFDKDHVVIVRLPDPEAIEGYQTFKNAALQYPEIINMSSATSVPGYEASLSLILPEGIQEDQSTNVRTIYADFDFIETLGITMQSGRSFSREFGSIDNAILINEATVRAFGWEDSIGKTFRFQGPRGASPPMEVNGVMRDFHNQSLHQPIEPLMIMLSPWTFSFLVIRIDGNEISRGLELLQEQWRQTYPSHPAMDYTFLDQNLEQLYQAEHQLGSVFVAGAMLSILIACCGLLGLLSFMTEQRLKEFAIHKIVGASIMNIVVLLSKDFTVLILLAFIIGAPIGYYTMNAWLEDFTYRIDLSVWVFVFSGLTVLVLAWLTVGCHALKAATANPVTALHAE